MLNLAQSPGAQYGAADDWTHTSPTPEADPRLDDGDRFARGELIHVFMGERYSRKLRSAAEWEAYDTAKRNGFLMLPNRSDATRRRLRNIWCSYTEPRRWPFVVVEPRNTWAQIELDMILVAPRPGEQSSNAQLSDGAVEAIRAIIVEHTKNRCWFSAGSTFSYTPSVPIAVAEHIAQRFFLIAMDDLSKGGAR